MQTGESSVLHTVCRSLHFYDKLISQAVTQGVLQYIFLNAQIDDHFA